jgi:polyhydroxybutyrate depolymerase
MRCMRFRGGGWAPLALACVLLAVTTGCRAGRSAGSAPPGTSTHTIRVDGKDRSFRLYRPAAVNGVGKAPLVVMLHGGFGTAKQAEQSYGWNKEADAEHFLVAYPDGVDRAWNVGGDCCGVPAKNHIDDVAFVEAMLAAIQRATPVDPARIYATGISNGGLLAYRLACDTSTFAAIGPDSATMLGDCPSPAKTSVIHIHGSADRNIPYDGSPGDGFATIDGPPVPDVITTWRRVDGCSPATASTIAPVTTSVANCADGRSVELIVVVGAGHQWPGAQSKPAAERALHLDPPSTALDATDTIWRFFEAHAGVA